MKDKTNFSKVVFTPTKDYANFCRMLENIVNNFGGYKVAHGSPEKNKKNRQFQLTYKLNSPIAIFTRELSDNEAILESKSFGSHNSDIELRDAINQAIMEKPYLLSFTKLCIKGTDNSQKASSVYKNTSDTVNIFISYDIENEQLSSEMMVWVYYRKE